MTETKNFRLVLCTLAALTPLPLVRAQASLNQSTTWLGNSSAGEGRNTKWAQNFDQAWHCCDNALMYLNLK